MPNLLPSEIADLRNDLTIVMGSIERAVYDTRCTGRADELIAEPAKSQLEEAMRAASRAAFRIAQVEARWKNSYSKVAQA